MTSDEQMEETKRLKANEVCEMIKLMICESDSSLIDVKVQAIKDAKWEPTDKGFACSGGPFGEYKLTVDGVGRAEITNFQDTMTARVVSENEKS